MHDSSLMALALTDFKKMTLTQKLTKVYAAADNDNTGKAIHISRFCFAGETKISSLLIFTFVLIKIMTKNLTLALKLKE